MLRSIIGFIIRVIALLLAVVLACAGIGAFISQQRPAAYTLWVIALLLIWATRRKKSIVNWRNDPASGRQKSFADELRIQYRKGATKGEMSDLIDAALDKRHRS